MSTSSAYLKKTSSPDMELVRLVAPFEHRGALIDLSLETTALFDCSDADTVIVLASMRDRLRSELGVWLTVSADYSAQLCARDVKTLSHLVALRHVVIHAESRSFAHAEIVRALLTNDEVNFDNELATIRGAYNRPAPPAPLTVWSADGGAITSELETLNIERSVTREAAELTYFS
jgi:hypothetical protein